MNDFDYDVMLKKRIASGARHRKCGSKSKFCGLPSDYMTRKERAAMNGPVKTYKLDEPMTFNEFLDLPDDLKKMYLQNLSELYGASNGSIAKMMGCTDVTVGRYKKILGIGCPGRGAGKRMSKDKKAMWEAFCNGVVGGGMRQLPEDMAEPEAETETETTVVEEPTREAGRVNSFTVNLSGIGSWEELYEALKSFPTTGEAMSVTVSVNN